MRAPLLLLSAGDDDFIPDVEIRAFHEELLEAGVPFKAKTYPGAPHSFFDRRYEEHADAARDALGVCFAIYGSVLRLVRGSLPKGSLAAPMLQSQRLF